MATDSTGQEFHEEAFVEQGLVDRDQTVRQDIGYDRDISSLPPLPPMPEVTAVSVPEADKTAMAAGDQSVSNVTPINKNRAGEPIKVLDAKPLYDWQLDEETKSIGRRGIAQARAALRSSKAGKIDIYERQHGLKPPQHRSTVR